ncbi:hypothetical protein VNO77_11181 [Canavalia gladiata]|uniref:Uncharacterized protein n=1 Tax=Canavalia gladiata TaxID=3824 RepID=A0AAN9QY82_CANGL
MSASFRLFSAEKHESEFSTVNSDMQSYAQENRKNYRTLFGPQRQFPGAKTWSGEPVKQILPVKINFKRTPMRSTRAVDNKKPLHNLCYLLRRRNEWLFRKKRWDITVTIVKAFSNLKPMKATQPHHWSSVNQNNTDNGCHRGRSYNTKANMPPWALEVKTQESYFGTIMENGLQQGRSLFDLINAMKTAKALVLCYAMTMALGLQEGGV